jgi:glycosyltransferase involved in cell wall biosynthesis
VSSPDNRPLRVAVLTGPYSSTQDAQVRALRDRSGAEVQIVYRRASADAPFADDEFASLPGALAWTDEIPAEEVQRLLDRLQPDVLLVTSWNHGVYMRLARTWRRRALRLMIMDNPWRGTAKQWGGLAVSRAYIRPAVDVAFLPNERQRVFARKLGFAERQIWFGAYGCDQPRFEVDPATPPRRANTFLFVGRLVRTKGVDVLLEAYAAR